MNISGRIRRAAYESFAEDAEVRHQFLLDCYGVAYDKEEAQSLTTFLNDFDFAWNTSTQLVRSDSGTQKLEALDRDAIIKAALELLSGTRREIGARVTSEKVLQFAAEKILCLDVRRWQPDETLADFIKRDFASDGSAFGVDRSFVRLPPTFNAMAFQQVTSIKIRWTDRLNEHLEVSNDDSEIAIFRDARFLRLLEESRFSVLFPDMFLMMTSYTYSLLLPNDNEKVRTWFQSVVKQNPSVDPSCGALPSLRKSKTHVAAFTFYQDRLMMAKEVFDSKQPRSLWQLWKDTRNTSQWWTFWIGLLVFTLGLMSCVLSAMQVYKAYHPTSA